MTSTPSRCRISAIASLTFITHQSALEVGWTERAFALHGGADQVSALMLEIMDATMKREAIVPNEQCVLLPFDAAVIVKMLCQRLQIVQKCPAFRFIPAHEVLEISRRREQRPAPGDGMDTDRGMDVGQFIFLEVMTVPQAHPLFGGELLIL